MSNISEKGAKKEKPTAKEKIETREKIVEELYGEKKEKGELLTKGEKIIREKLEREVAKMELNPELKEKAEEKARQIESLGEKGKLKRLLALAEEKGVVFAVRVAKGMKDPYTLDVFHDILAREGFYKKFQK